MFPESKPQKKLVACFAVCVFLFVAHTGQAYSQTISTVAGGGVNDGAPATAVGLSDPRGVAVDGAGNVYVAVPSQLRVRRILPNGSITTVIGNGVIGDYGDGGPAISAAIGSSIDIATDKFGNLFVSDYYKRRIRRIDTAGVVTSVAGSTDFGSELEDVPAVTARIYPGALALDDSGNLYFFDSFRRQIRRIDHANGLIRTVVGTGVQGYSGDGGAALAAKIGSVEGIAIDTSGNLYFSDNHSRGRIRKVSQATGLIETIAGNGQAGSAGDGGPAIDATLFASAGLALDQDENLYVVDSSQYAVRRILKSSGIIERVAGNGSQGFNGDGGPALAASFMLPRGIVFASNGDLIISDSGADRVRRVEKLSGLVSTIGGNGTFRSFEGDGGPATNAALSDVRSVAANTNGGFLVADRSNDRIRSIDTGGAISTVAGNGVPNFQGEGVPATGPVLSGPWSVAGSLQGGFYIVDGSCNCIRKVSPDGNISTFAGRPPAWGFSGDGGPATNALLSDPRGVAVDRVGRVIVADTPNGRLRRVSPAGVISTIAGGGDAAPGDGGYAIDALIIQPVAIAAGLADEVLFGQVNPARIRKISRDGKISTVAGAGFGTDGGPAATALLSGVAGLAVDNIGRIYFSESSRIRKIGTDGIVSTIAGGVDRGFYGDGGPAAAAQLNFPQQLSVDARGDLLIADVENRRIRKITFPFDVISVVSRKSHGIAGTFDLPIAHPLEVMSAGVEPRSGTAHRIVFIFNEPIHSVASANTNVGSAGFSFSGNEVEIVLTNVPDNTRVAISISGINGTLNVNATIGFLIGDINSSRTVNAGDISSIRANIGRTVSPSNFQHDLNLDGVIDQRDVSLAKGRAAFVQ